MKDSKAQMVVIIVGAINELFDEESHLKQLDWNKIDLTQFFTAYITAGSLIFNEVTNGDKNSLEFTHLANQLIVQDMLEKGKS